MNKDKLTVLVKQLCFDAPEDVSELVDLLYTFTDEQMTDFLNEVQLKLKED